MQSWHNEILRDKFAVILESIERVELWCKPYATADDFLCSPTGMAMLDASILRLQIIGETIRSIDDMTQGKLLCKYPAVPWKKIIGLRNLISHEYSNLNYTMIVRIIKHELTPLTEQVRAIMPSLQP